MKKLIATAVLVGSLLTGCTTEFMEQHEANLRLEDKFISAASSLRNQENIYTGSWNDSLDDKTALMHYLCRFEKDDLSSWRPYFERKGYDIDRLERRARYNQLEDKILRKFLIDYVCRTDEEKEHLDYNLMIDYVCHEAE